VGLERVRWSGSGAADRLVKKVWCNGPGLESVVAAWMAKGNIGWGTNEALSYGAKCPNGGACCVAGAALWKRLRSCSAGLREVGFGI
jgi:hypothetical protein